MHQKFDDALTRALHENRIVGAVLKVSERGQPVYERAIGLADRETGVPMATDARFRLASVTKPLMTVAFLSLVEDGLLDLDAPVTRWLPEFQPWLPDGSAPIITLHHLLTHTSGLGYRFFQSESGPYAVENISDGLDQPGLGLAENLQRLARAPLYFAPGAGWRYSLGLDVLGAVAEVATGQSLQEIVDERISAPLGLSKLAFHVPAERNDLVTPYVAADHAPRRMAEAERVPLWEEGGVTFAPGRVHDLGSFPSAGAGLVGTAPELLRFFEAMLAGGAPLLRTATVTRMMTNQLPHGLWTMHGPGWGFGYGWGILEEPQGLTSHLPKGILRWGGVYGHSWFMDPATGRAAVLLTNTAYEGMSGQLMQDVLGAWWR